VSAPTEAQAVPDRPGQAGPVLGDGTTARSRAGSRWRRWRWPLAVLALMAVVGALAALPTPRTTSLPLAPDSTSPQGARALAQILGRQGVDVTFLRRNADVVAAAGPGTTILLASDQQIWDESQLESLDGTGADLVLAGSSWAASLLAGVETTYEVTSADDLPELAADCDDPDAVAAGTVTSAHRVQAPAGGGTVICFRAPGDPQDQGAFATTTSGDHRIDVLADSGILTNARLADAGNAALALRVLGRHDHLIWYLPSFDDDGGESEAAGPGLGDLVPPWTGALALELCLVVVVIAVVRGRRLGRVVTEPLPVVVRSAETTRGRGRLYRRGRSYGHAAAALRAGAAARCARRLGLPMSAPASELIDSVAHATGRPTDAVAQLFYGPPPTDDPALARLARDLDEIESEVHRP